MIEIDLAWLLALPLLFALGWLTAKIDRRQDGVSVRDQLFQELSQGVAALVRDERKLAMGQLLSVVRSAPEQINLQIALGRLLREEGQPDRAIEAHLAVLGRSDLLEVDREAALLELARDYQAAGIIDRAMESYQMLESTAMALPGMAGQLDLLQRQRRWQEALVVLDRLLETAPETMSEADSTRYRGIRFHLLMELERGSEASAMLPAHPRLALSAETVEEGPYVCASCGYMGRQHAWQCPGCFSWDSMRAVSRS